MLAVVPHKLLYKKQTLKKKKRKKPSFFKSSTWQKNLKQFFAQAHTPCNVTLTPSCKAAGLAGREAYGTLEIRENVGFFC